MHITYIPPFIVTLAYSYHTHHSFIRRFSSKIKQSYCTNMRKYMNTQCNNNSIFITCKFNQSDSPFLTSILNHTDHTVYSSWVLGLWSFPNSLNISWQVFLILLCTVNHGLFWIFSSINMWHNIFATNFPFMDIYYILHTVIIIW